MSLEVHQKSRFGIENICFYSPGWPTEKQSTLAGLPTSRCMKKAPFTIKRQMNDVKNHDGCLSKSIKKADPASKISVFIVLTGRLRNSRYWQGYHREGAKKPFTKSHQMIENKIHVECLSESIKETDQVIIFRSGPREISNFLVLARRVKTRRH